MAYTPNANREVRNGKAMVSAAELADFKKQYGDDKTLRDLLNMDKGLTRRMSNADREPVHIDAEAGMTRGTRSYNAGAGRGYMKPDVPKADARDLEAGMSRGTRSFKADTSEVDRVKNLMEAGGVKADRVDEAGEPYKKGGKVKGWGKARGARAAKFY